MSVKIEEKFDYLLDTIVTTVENNAPFVSKMQKRNQRIRRIQIIFTTLTTILLGLKLGEISTSIAFVLSTLASAVTIFYNLKGSTELCSNISKYCIKLTGLSREILFYRKCTNTLEEEKFLEYSEKFFALKNEFDNDSISLINESLKKSQETTKNIKAL
jgi:hypothetical protein